MIVNILGPNGAGKSTAVRHLLKEADPIYEGQHDKIIGYEVGKKIAVVGRYTSPCGGCDTIQSQDEVRKRIVDFSKGHKHVVFEGVIVSTCFGRYEEFLRVLAKPYTFAFLLPSVEVCIERVMKRRAARGAAGKTFNTAALINKHNYVTRMLEKCRAEDIPHVVLDPNTPIKKLKELLK